MGKIVDFNNVTDKVPNTKEFLDIICKAFAGYDIHATFNDRVDIYLNIPAYLDIRDTLQVCCNKDDVTIKFNITNVDGCQLSIYVKNKPVVGIISMCKRRLESCYIHFDNSMKSLTWILSNIDNIIKRVKSTTVLKDAMGNAYIERPNYYLYDGEVELSLAEAYFASGKHDRYVRHSIVKHAVHEYLITNGFNDSCFEEALCIWGTIYSCLETVKVYYHGHDHRGNEVLLACDDNGVRIASKEELKPYMLKECIE